jgi:hypothetical protein
MYNGRELPKEMEKNKDLLKNISFLDNFYWFFLRSGSIKAC